MLRRAFALLTAAWLAIAIAEPAALHACAMHGGAAPAASHHAHDVDHGAGHGAATEQPATPADTSHACTCLGDCCAVAVTPVPTAELATFAPTTVRREVAFPAARVAARGVAGLVLPFATAPPILPTIPLISLG